jgi:hypothetical protein
MNLKNM